MDFRNIIKKMREIDPTTPGQDLQHFTALAESTGISLGAEDRPSPAKPTGKEVITEGVEVVAEKAVSKAQQKLMGQAYALKKGDMKAKDASKEVKKLAKDMSKSDLKDFASTKHKGKPEHVKKKKEVKEGGVGNLKIEMEDDAAQMSKEEFIKTHGEKYAHIWDRVQGQMKGDPKYDESRVNEAEKTKYSLDDLKKQRDKLASRTKELEKLGKDDKKKNESVELVDDFGEIVEAKKSAAQKKAQEKFKAMVKGKKGDDKDSMDESSAKPDYIDIDKDGDKKEPMKKAVKDAKKGKKKTVKESVEPKMSFVEMMKLVRESGGQQAIDPMDDVLWNWANRVAVSKVEESAKQEIFAAMVYERNGGRFEMYDVIEKGLNEGKDCNCGPDCECKGNCGSDCNCGPNCGK